MNKVTEYLYENRKQKGDGGNCLPVVSATMRSTTDTDKIIREESELKDQMSAFYNSITSSQPKELASDTYILPNFSENQCKSNKNQYKNISNMSNECNKHNSVTTDKCVKMSDRDDIDGSYASDSDSTDSDFSNFSGLSDLSGQEWKPITKTLTWVNKQMNSGVNPRDLLSHYLSNGVQIAPNLNDMSLWRLLANMLTEPPRRQKLRHINTIDDVVKLLNESNNIIVLTGAGVSVSCGIPDFRSSDGIYSRLAKDFPDLPDPQAMFDINYFSRDPRPFYKFAREIYPGQFVPSPCHKFIKLLEKKQKLLRNYTQNIDTLEQVAGIQNVIECHGSFATASCTKCRYKATADAIRDDIFSQRIPLCPRCHRNDNMFSEESSLSSASMEPLSYSDLVQSGIMKPDIVFFGEGLPDAFHSAMASDKDKCDLLIVIGSSLKVRPVALIPSSIPSNVPQILINREHLNHLEFDVELLGDSDIIINQLCHLLGEDWKEVCWDANILTECRHLKTNSSTSDDVLVATIDTDSQSTKSAITTNSSNGVFCDSGFESSSSLHAAQIMDGEKTFDQDQPQPADEQEQIQVRLSCEATTTNCFVTDNTISCTDETPVIDFTDERPVMDLTTEDGRNQTENLDRLQENLSLRHIAIDNSLTESSDLVPVSDCRIDPVEHRVNVEDDDGDVNDEDDDSDVDVDDPNGLKGGKISFSSPSPSYCSINKQISVAKRLQENTYYYNPSTSSYVFPGAQVYWSSDSEYDDDGDEDYIDEEEECDLKVDDTNPSGKSVVKRKHEINQNNDSDNDSPPNKRRKKTPVTEI